MSKNLTICSIQKNILAVVGTIRLLLLFVMMRKENLIIFTLTSPHSSSHLLNSDPYFPPKTGDY